MEVMENLMRKVSENTPENQVEKVPEHSPENLMGMCCKLAGKHMGIHRHAADQNLKSTGRSNATTESEYM